MHRTRVKAPLLLLATAIIASGCGAYTTLASEDRTTSLTERILEARTTYTVAGVALVGDTLAVRLERECAQVREVDETRVRVEQRDYTTSTLWWVSGGIWAAAIAIAMPLMLAGDCDLDEEAAGECTESDTLRGAGAAVAAIGNTSAAAVAGTAAYYEFFAEDTVEVPLGVETRRHQELTACNAPWPSGTATLMAPQVEQSFDGRSRGNGRYDFDVTGSAREVWLEREPLRLALPDELDWIDVEVPDAVRAALLDSEAASQAQRVFVVLEHEAQSHSDLLSAATVRVQSVMTATRRFHFVSDAQTQARIARVVERGGGNAEARRKSALKAARAEDVQRVVALTITPLFDTQVQLSMAVFDTSTGDQIYATQAPADLDDAATTLEAFAGLAEAFVAWERR